MWSNPEWLAPFFLLTVQNYLFIGPDCASFYFICLSIYVNFLPDRKRVMVQPSLIITHLGHISPRNNSDEISPNLASDIHKLAVYSWVTFGPKLQCSTFVVFVPFLACNPNAVKSFKCGLLTAGPAFRPQYTCHYQTGPYVPKFNHIWLGVPCCFV